MGSERWWNCRWGVLGRSEGTPLAAATDPRGPPPDPAGDPPPLLVDPHGARGEVARPRRRPRRPAKGGVATSKRRRWDPSRPPSSPTVDARRPGPCRRRGRGRPGSYGRGRPGPSPALNLTKSPHGDDPDLLPRPISPSAQPGGDPDHPPAGSPPSLRRAAVHGGDPDHRPATIPPSPRPCRHRGATRAFLRHRSRYAPRRGRPGLQPNANARGDPCQARRRVSLKPVAILKQPNAQKTSLRA